LHNNVLFTINSRLLTRNLKNETELPDYSIKTTR
jgi:hypothetical protein